MGVAEPFKKKKKGGDLMWNSCSFPHPESITQGVSDLPLSSVQLFSDGGLFWDASLKFEELCSQMTKYMTSSPAGNFKTPVW